MSVQSEPEPFKTSQNAAALNPSTLTSQNALPRPTTRHGAPLKPSTKYKAEKSTEAVRQASSGSVSYLGDNRDGSGDREASVSSAFARASTVLEAVERTTAAGGLPLLDDSTRLANLVKMPARANAKATKRKRFARSCSRGRSNSESPDFVMYSPSHFLNASDDSDSQKQLMSEKLRMLFPCCVLQLPLLLLDWSLQSYTLDPIKPSSGHAQGKIDAATRLLWERSVILLVESVQQYM